MESLTYILIGLFMIGFGLAFPFDTHWIDFTAWSLDAVAFMKIAFFGGGVSLIGKGVFR